MFDCIVVGAGPAGASAAYHLAKRGRSVLLLEKHSLPRYKPCSGGVSPVVAQWFDFDFAPAIAQKVEMIRYTWKLEDPVIAKLETREPMWLVQRDVFDHFLVQQAQQQGAELRDRTEVCQISWQGDYWQVSTMGESVTGRYLIAADGAEGPLRRWLGFKPAKQRLGAVMETPTNGHTRQDVWFEFGLVKNGSIWSFPKGDHTTVGIATFIGGEPSDLTQTLQEYALQAGVATADSHPLAHPLALWDGNQKLHGQNALLVGEAAALVDPFTAEGIRPGMYSGMKAAAAIDQALQGNQAALENYTQTIHQEWGADLAWAQKLAGLFYRMPGVAYRLGIKRPMATQRIGQILCGELRYADVANYAIKKLSGSLIPGRG
jgi:geranylgeranyl reductase family protein